jgi:hypothetical protein
MIPRKVVFLRFAPVCVVYLFANFVVMILGCEAYNKFSNTFILHKVTLV